VEANISWLTPVVVGLLNDTESSNQAHMWEALLTFFKCTRSTAHSFNSSCFNSP
jgi:hypothetical protein